jgi:PAS domain S-box-containing protein
MSAFDNEDEALRSVALQNAGSILIARQRAEEELLRTREALRESEEQLRAILSQAAVGIAVAALDGRFLDVNHKFAEILGYTADELLGLTFRELTHPDDEEITAAKVSELVSGVVADIAYEKRYVRKDGSVVWSMTTVTLMKDSAGQPERFIGVIEDITSRKEIENDNARLYEAAQKASEERKFLLESERAARTAAERMSDMKDEFLATLSHELRTPLNAIVGWSQVLRKGSLSEVDYLKGLETIERNARMQTRLIEDLLDMSRIASGKLRLEVQPLHPASFIEAAIETVTPAAAAKGIRLEKRLDMSAGLIAGDPERLQQVAWNLLSNAIKFTPKDGRVEVVLERVDSHVEIRVSDTGIGISPEFIPHLFERFRQGDARSTRSYGGLGLGLSIVKNLVELHGGTVSARSPGKDKGTTISLQLPVTAVHRLAMREGLRTPSGYTAAELSGLRILVVDDQADARELIKRVLTDCGAEVVSVSSADDAMAAVQSRKLDLLISDIGMPETDGFELLRRIHALNGTDHSRLPAIALTAFARSEDRIRALRAGFLVHVSKPVDPSELIATVASVTRRLDGRGSNL